MWPCAVFASSSLKAMRERSRSVSVSHVIQFTLHINNHLVLLYRLKPRARKINAADQTTHYKFAPQVSVFRVKIQTLTETYNVHSNVQWVNILPIYLLSHIFLKSLHCFLPLHSVSRSWGGRFKETFTVVPLVKVSFFSQTEISESLLCRFWSPRLCSLLIWTMLPIG